MVKVKSLAERQIAKAQAEGKLSGLEGEGKPLPDRPVETSEEASLSVGMRAMAEAGILPEEFALKRDLIAARQAVASAADGKDRKRLMARVADLELQYEIAREARRKFFT